MTRFWPYVVKTLWRHRTRTMLTLSGTAVAVFVFACVSSVQQSLTKLTRQDDSVLIVFQANKFCPATSHLPQDYDSIIEDLPGVREVVPIQVFTNNCRASLDVVVFYGVDASQVRRVRDFELINGSWEDFESHQNAAIIGSAALKRRRALEGRDIQVGDTVTIGDVTVTLAGVFTSANRPEEDYVYCHLDFLQRTRGLDLVGTVTQHEVFLDEGADSAAVAETIDEMLKSGQVETDTKTKGAFQAASLADLVQLIELLHYLGYACLGLMVVLLSTTTVMAVEDRIQEHAVLQTIGLSHHRVFGLVLWECLLVCFAGGLAGVVASQAALSVGNISLGAEAVTIAPTPSMAIAVNALGMTCLLGLVAGMLPAAHAARADIVTALRRAG